MAQSAGQQVMVLTDLAKIYSHPLHGRDPEVMNRCFNHDVIDSREPLESGLTPLDIKDYRSDPELRFYEIMLGYQRARFCMFTTAELEASDAWAPVRTSGTYSLLSHVPLHPLVDKPQWIRTLPLHMALNPLRNGRPGYWTASNDVVWNAMLPSLHLASQYLYQEDTLQWWYSLFFGDYELMELDEIEWDGSDQIPPERFFAYHPQLSKQADDNIYDKVQQKFVEMCSKIEMHISSGFVSDENGDIDTFCDGTTIRPTSQQVTRIFVHLEIVEPLLNNDITVAERMLNIHILTITILHELSHAVWRNIKHEHRTPRGEPYFEGDVITELGFSLQNAVWGGIDDGFLGSHQVNAKGVPPGGLHRRAFNKYICQRLSPDYPTVKTKPLDYDEYVTYPVHLESLFHENNPLFWQTFVRQIGPTGTHLHQGSWGTKFIQGQGHAGFVEDPGKYRLQDYIIVDESRMSDMEIAEANRENARRQHAIDVTDNIRQISAARSYYIFPQDSTYASKDKSSKDDDPNEILPTPQCPRFAEIRKGLFTSRKDLKWDNFNFCLSEHILYAYINRYVPNWITPDEWRNFLITCNNTGTLFYYEYIGGPPTPHQGFVTRNSSGWPPPLRESTRNPPPPSAIEMESFLQGMKRVRKRDGRIFFEDGQWNDFDKNLLRRMVNDELQRRAIDMNGKPVRGNLNVAAFDRCIAQFERQGSSWCFGPPGIIRKCNWNAATWD